MTRAECERIVAWWVPRLGLTHWDLQVCWEKDEHGGDFAGDDSDVTHGMVWRGRDYEKARLYLRPDRIEEWDAREANVTIVHELLHLVGRDVEHILDLIEDRLSKEVMEVVETSFKHAIEGAIERTAVSLVELAPALPPAARLPAGRPGGRARASRRVPRRSG